MSPTKPTNEQSLKAALEAMVDGYGLRSRLDEQAVRAAWPDLAGAMIARHTMEIKLTRGRLTVKVDSAPLREELHYMRDTLIELINRRLERDAVKEIRVV